MKSLRVSVSGIPVGKLIQDHREGHYFQPDPEWLQNDQRPVLSLFYRQNLAGSETITRSTHLPMWFENLLPEREGELRRLLCGRLHLRDGQSFALLAALGKDLPGSIVITPEQNGGNGDEDALTPHEPDSDLHFSSLAGVQLKFSMAAHGKGFTLPVKDGEGAWIVKIPTFEWQLLPQIEHATMCWARAVGLEVPECRVVPMDAIHGLESFVHRGIGEAFAIRRYDRVHGGGRVHQEDFAQVLNFDPRHKYGQSSYEGTSVATIATMATVAKIVRDACSPEVLSDLIRRYVFVIASGNGDAHLKNWSLIYSGDSPVPTLAPCYDQVSTIACDPSRFGWDQSQPPSLALKFGGAKSFRQVNALALQRFAVKLGMAKSNLEDLFRDSLRDIRRAWTDVESMAPEVMRSAVAEHWKNVPLLEYFAE